MRNWVLLLVFISSGTLLSQENKGAYEIYGEIEGAKSGKIKLLYDGKSYRTKVKDGKFMFEGNIEHEHETYFVFKGTRSIPFYMEDTIMKVNLMMSQLHRKQGDVLIWRIIPDNLTYTDSLSRDYDRFKGKYRERVDFNLLLFNYLEESITKNPDNYLYVDIINSLCTRRKYLNRDQLYRLAHLIDLSIMSKEEKQTLMNNLMALPK